MSNIETVKKKMEQMKTALISLHDQVRSTEDELDHKNACSQDLQSQTDTCNQQIADLEDQLDATESKFQTLFARLSAAEKKVAEDKQAFRLLEERKVKDDDYVIKLENELSELNESNLYLAKTLESLTIENAEVELKIDDEEERAMKLNERTKDLEARIINTSGVLKTLELSETETIDRNSIKEQRIEEVTQKMKDCSERSERFETQIENEMREMEDQEAELATVRGEYHRVKSEVDAMVLEIWEM